MVLQDEKREKSLWFRRTNGFVTWKHNLWNITTGVHLCHSYINSEGIFEQKKKASCCISGAAWKTLVLILWTQLYRQFFGFLLFSWMMFFWAKHYEVSGWFIAFDALITSFQLCLCLISNESKPFKCMSTANEHV